MWGRVAKIALSLPFLIVAGLFGLYLVFGFFLVNPLAQKLLPQQTTIDDDALVKLAEARGQAMRDALLKLGLDAGRVGVSAPAQQTAKDNLVGSKMSLGAGKKPAAESASANATSS